MWAASDPNLHNNLMVTCSTHQNVSASGTSTNRSGASRNLWPFSALRSAARPRSLQTMEIDHPEFHSKPPKRTGSVSQTGAQAAALATRPSACEPGQFDHRERNV